MVYTADTFVAIEVKRKRTLVSHDLNGMKAFASEYPEARKIIFYGGDHEEMLDGIQLIPLAKAFPTLEYIIWPNQAKPVGAPA